jgi:hypothetical protein
MTKEAVSKILGRTKPTLSAFRALVADTETVLNDRPLESPSSVVSDGESLSPAHLMYGRRLKTLHYNEEIDYEKLDSTYGERPNELKKAVIGHQTLLGHLKNRFLASYLSALREYHQATKKKPENGSWLSSKISSVALMAKSELLTSARRMEK